MQARFPLLAAPIKCKHAGRIDLDGRRSDSRIPMTGQDPDTRMEQFLAAALRGDAPSWPSDWQDKELEEALVAKAFYHGVAGMLVEDPQVLANWPPAVALPIREQALAQAMWELRHRIVLAGLLETLDREEIVAVVLKGTALAYDIYNNPASRARADTDLLIGRGDLEGTRDVLRKLGFSRATLGAGAFGDMHLQEVWQHEAGDGTMHDIDLHWQAINAPALEGLLSLSDCLEDSIGLTALSASAITMDRAKALLFACLHRAGHVATPYYSQGIAHYGGDRLIWLKDMDLLARKLSQVEWKTFGRLAAERGVARLCLDGLALACERFGTQVPPHVTECLAAAPQASLATAYLLDSNQLDQAWQNFKSISGLKQKSRFVLAQALPSREYMRAKYSGIQAVPLLALYIWRIAQMLSRLARLSKP